MIDSTPSLVDVSMTSFMAGIIISQPSRPKRFSDENFLAKKASNLLDSKALALRRKIIRTGLTLLHGSNGPWSNASGHSCSWWRWESRIAHESSCTAPMSWWTWTQLRSCCSKNSPSGWGSHAVAGTSPCLRWRSCWGAWTYGPCHVPLLDWLQVYRVSFALTQEPSSQMKMRDIKTHFEIRSKWMGVISQLWTISQLKSWMNIS